MLRTSLIQPLLENELLKEFKLKQHNESIEKGKFDCVTLDYPLRANVSVPDNFFPKSCFEATQPVLRINTLGSYVQVLYNQVILFKIIIWHANCMFTLATSPRWISPWTWSSL